MYAAITTALANQHRNDLQAAVAASTLARHARRQRRTRPAPTGRHILTRRTAHA